MKDGEGEGGGFAGAGLGAAEDVLAGHHVGDSLGLDGCGDGVILCGEGAENGFGQAEGCERSGSHEQIPILLRDFAFPKKASARAEVGRSGAPQLGSFRSSLDGINRLADWPRHT
jgi:hypothetical protein